jgi:hypothetical protein
MSKVLKGVAAIGLTIGAMVLAGPAAGLLVKLGIGAAAATAISTVGLTLGAGLLGKVLGLTSAPRASPAARDRLRASFDVNAPRKIIFGRTAMATDLRYQAYTGSDQEYLHWIVCVASHEVEAIEEIWFDSELAWSQSGGVASKYSGYLTITPRLVGTSGNGIAIDSVWTSACTLTGCAYFHARFKLTGNSKKAESPFASSVPTRITVRGKGAKVPDPRLSTSAGGSGSQSMSDQATWAYATAATSGRNPACQLLLYLLGWRINGKLAVGRGYASNRIDYDSFITAANLCDEAVTLAAAGTEPRYRSDGIFSEADDPGQVVGSLLAAMNADLRDDNGRIAISVRHNDLSDPDIVELSDDDILGSESWRPVPGLDQLFNIVRGEYVDPSNAALYQMVEAPEVALTSLDGLDRIDSFSLANVQSASQWQRLAKQRLQRAQYQGVYSADFGVRAWRCNLGRPVRLSHRGLGWADKLFRVTAIGIRRDGTVPVVLQEEHASIYAWDAEEAAAVSAAVPTVYDPLLNPVVVAIGGIQEGATRNVNRGTWAAGEDYVVGDFFEYEGSSYTVTVAHTSVAEDPPLNANVSLFVGGGQAGLAAYLTNESHTVPADASGNVTSAAGASGRFVILRGTAEIEDEFTFSVAAQYPDDGSWSISIDADGDYIVTDATFSGDGPATADFFAEHNLSGLFITKRFTLNKSRAGAGGAAGAAAKLLYVISDRQIITYDGAGAISPAGQTISFTIQRQNLTQAFTISMTDAAGNAVNANTYVSNVGGTLTPSGNNALLADTSQFTVSAGSFDVARGSSEGIIVTVAHADGVSDKLSIVRTVQGAPGEDGAPGAPGAAGVSGIVIPIYKRSATSPSLPSATTTYDFTTKALTGLNNGWTTTIPAGDDPLWVSAATASSATSTDTIAASEWAAAVEYVRHGEDGDPGAPGAPGLNTATVFLFKRNSTGTTPAAPSTTTTYAFATGLLTGTLDGWSQTIPPASDGSHLFATTATALTADADDNIPASEWAAVRLIAVDGTKGANTATVYIYRRSSTEPTLPSAETTYTFATSTLTGLNNSWSTTIPAGTDPLYVSAATASSTASTDTIAASEWASPVILVRDGEDGADGLNTATVFLYKRNATGTAPAAPTTLTTYTFATGVLSGTLDGWTQTVPSESIGPYLFVTTATALATTADDNIPASEWATVRRMAVDGASPVVGRLTNESHTVAATSAGVVSSFAGAGGTFLVYDGLEDVSDECSFSVVSETGVDVSIDASGVYTVNSMSADSGTAVLRATYDGDPIDLTYSIAKSKAGATGPGGPVIELSATEGAFLFTDQTAVNSSQSITLTATRQNTSETVTFSTSPSVTLGGSGLTRTLSITDFGTNRQVVVTATGDTSGAKDTFTIYRLERSTAEAGSTLGENLLWNGNLTAGVVGWTVVNGSRVAGVAGDPAPYVFSKTSGAGYLQAVTGLLPLPPGGDDLYLSFRFKGLSGNSAQAVINFYDATGAFVAQSSPVAAITSSSWTLVENKVARPAGTSFYLVDCYGYEAGVTTATMKIGSFRMSTIQQGADVTAKSQVLVQPPASIRVSADSAGTMPSGTLPKTAIMSVTRGGTSIRTDADTTYSAVFSGGTGSINNTTGADKGTITWSTITADEAYVSVTVTVGGIAQPAVRHYFYRDRAASTVGSPPSGGSGDGPIYDSEPAVSNVTSTSNTTLVSPFTVRAGNTGKITLNFSASYTQQQLGSCQLIVGLYIRTEGSGSYTLVGSEQTGSYATRLGAVSSPDDETGYVGYQVDATGLTIGNDYEIQVVGRVSGTSPSASLSGYLEGTAG